MSLKTLSTSAKTHLKKDSHVAEPTSEQPDKQIMYRDARFTNKYDDIWQSVGKCVFCDLNEKYIFFEENGVVMTISLYAYVDGHFMIVPRRHVRSVKELTELEWSTIRKFMYIAKRMIKEVHGVKGMQFVQKDGARAQSTVEHIHFHCIPFDSPDLSVWNYRKLANTPLENVTLYKNAGKKLVATDVKFQKKYQQSNSLAIVCDVIIQNERDEILFEERGDAHKLIPDYITLPGGRVDDLSKTLEEELAREVLEETTIQLAPDQFTLASSRIDQVTRNTVSPHLQAAYPTYDSFIRNTYLASYTSTAQPQAQDDASELLWLSVDQVLSHDRVSPSTKEIIKKVCTS